MAGTKAGAAKRRKTLIKKAGSKEAYLKMQRELAAKGGANHNPDNKGSFANRTKSERTELAAAGGKAGKRPAATNAVNDQADQQARRGVEHRQTKAKE